MALGRRILWRATKVVSTTHRIEASPPILFSLKRKSQPGGINIPYKRPKTASEPTDRNLIHLLDTYLKTKSYMSIETMNESVLQAIVEEVAPDLPMSQHSHTKKYQWRLDIFITSDEPSLGTIIELECPKLKELLLGYPNRDKYSKRGDERMERLRTEDKESLLARNYCDQSGVLRNIGGKMEETKNKLSGYMGSIASGIVTDERVIGKVPDKLEGYVIMVVGRRVLWENVSHM